MSIVVTPTVTITAQTIISRAMRLLGVYNIGETPSPSESTDSLLALNAMLDSWATDGMAVFAPVKEAIPLTAALASVTAGPSGTYVTDRPIEVLSANLTLGGVIYPIDLTTMEEYNAIPQPSTTGTPRWIWCRMDMPNITITPYPVPSEAATLNIWTTQQIRYFGALTTEVALPPGYDRALAYNLAVEIAPEFEKEASPTVKTIAASSLRGIKRVNLSIPPLGMPAPIPGRHHSNIFAG
jgi:hypothetical protein